MASLSSNLDALVANSAETVASQERWTKNMREDIDELADRTCKLLDLVTDPERGTKGVMRMRWAERWKGPGCGCEADGAPRAFALLRRAVIASEMA